MRSLGFYWVYSYGEWTIAEYVGGCWYMIGGDEPVYNEDEFDEIGEKVERNIK